MTVMTSTKTICSRCGSDDAPRPLPKQYGCATCGQRPLCYACDTSHGSWCGVVEPGAVAADFRDQGCRFPEEPHTCFYVCEEDVCEARVEDHEVAGDEVFCAQHRPVRTVADIRTDHVGWMIKVHQPLHTDDGRHLINPHRTFTLGKGFTRGPSQGCVRQWTRPDGTTWVGLVDDETRPGIVGTEHMFPADTPCELVRQVKKTTRRRNR